MKHGIIDKAYELAKQFAKTGNFDDERELMNYASDHDIFVMIDDDRVHIEDDYFMYQFDI